MPSYEEALASDPTAFVEYASAMRAAQAGLSDYWVKYDMKVVEINESWDDQANTAFNGDVTVVKTHLNDVAAQIGEAAELLGDGASRMVEQVAELKALDDRCRALGFTVQPEPLVEPGWFLSGASTMAGLLFPPSEAWLQAIANWWTERLRAALAELTETDLAVKESLDTAAERLQPLEEKTVPPATICPPVVDDGKADQDEPKPDRKDEQDADRPSGDGDKENEDEEDEEDERPEEDRPEDRQPENEPPEQPRPEAERPEIERPDEMERPEPVQPNVPDYYPDPSDLYASETPDYDSSWDPSELEGTEPSGGLASGVGGGIGGAGGLSTGGPGPVERPSGGASGPVGGVIGAPAGGNPSTPTTGPGARSRPLGGMVGAPGARGAANPDDEVERESFLLEDPEEDVWGIGRDEDSPYGDHRQESDESELPPVRPVDELPSFDLPGFDLPGGGRS